MTNEEAIEIMEVYRDKLINSVSNQLDGDIEALDMAIQALSQINDIKAIINNPMYIQEDVLRYQMICEVIRNDIKKVVRTN